MGSVHSEVSEGTAKKAITGHGPFLDNTLYPMHKVDLLIIKQGASIAWHEMTDGVLTGKARRWWDAYGYNPADFEKMSPEFVEALHDRADYLVSATQPMFFPESRNAYSASDKPFLKELARFRAFTDQLLRAQNKQIALWRQGEISNREMGMSVGRGMVFASVWYNGLRWIWDAIFGDDDKEKDVVLEMLLGPLSWIPFIGWPLKSGVSQLISDTSGYGPADFTTITFDQINHTKDTVYTIAKALFEEDSQKADDLWEKAMKEGAKDILIIFFGLPDYPVDWFFEDEAERPNAGNTIH